MPSVPVQFNPMRVRSYIFRLPLATRLLLTACVVLWVLTIPLEWLRDWACLEPEKINLSTMHRLNLFPLMHLGFFHMFFNVIALAPLLERFESEFGTLVTLALFTGPFGLLPGGLYTLLEKFVLRSNTAVMGASVWTFLLLSSEALKTSRTSPHFTVGPISSSGTHIKIPTWSTPLILLVLTSVLVPGVSLLGHLCGAAVGFLWGSGYIKFLVPHEWILRKVESKLNLLGRLPHYVSVDQKTYGRYGVLPTSVEMGAAGKVRTPEGTPPEGVRLGP